MSAGESVYWFFRDDVGGQYVLAVVALLFASCVGGYFASRLQ